MGDARMTVRLLACGLAGPALFVAGFVAQDVLKPGFDPSRQFISHLSLGPYGWVNSSLLVVSGCLFVLFGIGLHRLAHSDPRVKGISVPITVFGMSIMATGVFVIDPGLGYPPGTLPDAPSWHGMVHDAAGALAFLAVTTGTVMAGRKLDGRPPWANWAALSYGACVVIVIAFALTSVLAGLDYAGTYQPAPAGVAERIYLTAALVWVAALAWRASKAAEVTPAAVASAGAPRYSSRKFSK